MADDSSNSSTSLGDSPAKPTPSDPKPHRPTLRDWLELARISNLPTVWTNVMVGVACGQMLCVSPEQLGDIRRIDVDVEGFLSASTVTALIAGMSFLYIAGMILNDIADVKVDRIERPGRPLPSGRISVKAAVVVTTILFALGTGAIALAGASNDFSLPAAGLALALASTIAAYDFTHKLTAASVVLMGACRGLVYVAATLVVGLSQAILSGGGSDYIWRDPLLWAPPAALALYTVCITIVSRSEVSNVLDLRKYLAVVMPVGVLAMVGVLKPAKMEWWIAVAAFAVSLWLARAVKFVFAKPAKTVPAILTWLSGMCLIDAYFLTLLGYPFAALIAGGCFALTAWGHRKILGT